MADKKNNKKKAALIAAVCLVVIICAGTGFYMFKEKNTDKTSELSSSLSEPSQTSDIETQNTSESITQTFSTASEVITVTTQQSKGYSLPLSINQALNALEEHYGSDFKINSTIEENGFNYFAIFLGEEKYASVQVDMATGKSTETIIATGEKTEFDLV